MNRYELYINGPTAKFKETVKAERISFNRDRINFYENDKLKCSYPGQYTTIEKIKYGTD